MIDMSMPADGYLVSRLTNVILCGYCNAPKNDDHSDDECGLLDLIESGYYTWEDVLNQFPDYYADDTTILEESNVSADPITRDEEWAGIYQNRDAYQQARSFRYNDVEPNRCTHAIAWRHNNHAGNYPDKHMPKPMRVNHQRIQFTEDSSYEQSYDALDYESHYLSSFTFNELQAMASVKLIDHNITERYQYHFFNAFWGRDNRFHIGSITISTTIDNRKQATCTKCKQTLVAPAEPTVDQMRTFVHACIRHGNNHGPQWLTNRSDFAYIHAQNCDTNHATSEGCNANVDRYSVEELTSEGQAFQFLMHHRRFCVSNSCRCTHYYHLLAKRDRELTSA